MQAINSATVSCGGAFSFVVSASDDDLPANDRSYSLQGQVPAGAAIDAATGAFYWAPDTDQLGSHQITMRVTDNGTPALFHERTVTLTLEDLQGPVAKTQDITIQLDASGTAEITPAQLDGGTTDNCTIVSMTLSKQRFSCADVGTNEVVLEVQDGAGNSATATAIVTVEYTPGKAAPAAEGTWQNTLVYNTESTYALAAVAGATAYHWSVPAGFELVSGQNTRQVSIKALSGTASGTISVSAHGACGEGEILLFPMRSEKAPATITITDLMHDFTGTPKTAAILTDPAGLPVDVRYNGIATAPTAVGEYTLTVRVVDPNYAAEATAVMHISPLTAVPDTEVADRATFYPNPTTGKVILEFKEGITALLTVRDASGRLVKKVQLTATYILDLGQQAAGLYFLTLEQEGKSPYIIKISKL